MQQVYHRTLLAHRALLVASSLRQLSPLQLSTMSDWSPLWRADCRQIAAVVLRQERWHHLHAWAHLPDRAPSWQMPVYPCVYNNGHSEGWLVGGAASSPTTQQPFLRMMPPDPHGRYLSGYARWNDDWNHSLERDGYGHTLWNENGHFAFWRWTWPDLICDITHEGDSTLPDDILVALDDMLARL